ncbi:hypothetical protein DOY81_011570, partial [Sarcophaga bullata]
MWGDTILIVFISICTALLGEGLTWLLVYRTEKYQKLKGEVEKQSKKCKGFLGIGLIVIHKHFAVDIVVHNLQWHTADLQHTGQVEHLDLILAGFYEPWRNHI